MWDCEFCRRHISNQPSQMFPKDSVLCDGCRVASFILWISRQGQTDLKQCLASMHILNLLRLESNSYHSYAHSGHSARACQLSFLTDSH